MGAKPGPAAHSLDAASYGSADKSCGTYLEARTQHDAVYWGAAAEFTGWLGGYLSGVNAAWLVTTNVLGKAELSDALTWLESYCGAHPGASFGAAAEVLITADRPFDTDSRAVSR